MYSDPIYYQAYIYIYIYIDIYISIYASNSNIKLTTFIHDVSWNETLYLYI